MVADESWLARPAFLTAADRQNPYLHSWSLFFKHLMWPTPAVSARPQRSSFCPPLLGPTRPDPRPARTHAPPGPTPRPDPRP